MTEVSVEHILKLSVYSAQPLLAGGLDKLVGYSELQSQQYHWHLATRGLAWQLQMRPLGWDWRGGMVKALDCHWASASSLKRVLQDGRWRTLRAGGALSKLPRPLGGTKQLCRDSSHHHLASVAAGPTGGIKICSSRWKDRQCKTCPGVLCDAPRPAEVRGCTCCRVTEAESSGLFDCLGMRY